MCCVLRAALLRAATPLAAPRATAAASSALLAPFAGAAFARTPLARLAGRTSLARQRRVFGHRSARCHERAVSLAADAPCDELCEQPASAGAPADAPVAVWLKPAGVPGAQYSAVKGVDLRATTVDDLKVRAFAEDKLDAPPSHITLRLVACGARPPSADDEAAAVALDDPSISLAAAGMTGTAWLLACGPPARLLSVASRAGGSQLWSQWLISTQADLDLRLKRGLLWQMDVGGQLIRSVALLAELSEDPAAQYFFKDVNVVEAFDSATAAFAYVASGTARESTRGIAADALVQRTFGALTPLLGGEPWEFTVDERPFLEVDGLLGTNDHSWVLLNSVKLTAGHADVYEVMAAALKLHQLLHNEATCQPSLAAYGRARVHAFLSASHFLPGVQELAVQKGVTPMQCSGTSCHVPAHAAPSLPAIDSAE